MTTNGIGDAELSGGRMRLPRTRGAVSGLVLVVLGAWGGLVPFIGPYFNFAFTPDPNTAWHWTAARGWYEVLPGAVALVGGLILLFSANRALTVLGGWLAVAAGGWFVVGPQIAPLLTLGGVGSPANGGQDERTVATLVYFYALGAVIILFGALAVGRLSVRSVRDVRAAARRDAEAQAAEAERERVEAEAKREDEARARGAAERDAAQPTREPTNTDENGPSADESEAPREPQPAHEAAPDDESADSRTGTEVPAHDDGSTPETASRTTGPGYATPQRYERPSAAQQIPVEQIQRDHPTE